MSFTITQRLWENVPKETARKCPAARLCKFCSFRMYIKLFKLVHKFKYETNLTLLST